MPEEKTKMEILYDYLIEIGMAEVDADILIKAFEKLDELNGI